MLYSIIIILLLVVIIVMMIRESESEKLISNQNELLLKHNERNALHIKNHTLLDEQITTLLKTIESKNSQLHILLFNEEILKKYMKEELDLDYVEVHDKAYDLYTTDQFKNVCEDHNENYNKPNEGSE